MVRVFASVLKAWAGYPVPDFRLHSIKTGFIEQVKNGYYRFY